MSRLLLFWYHFAHFGSGVSATCFTVVVGDLISAQTLDPTSACCDGGFGCLHSGCGDGSLTWCAWSSYSVCADPGSAS